MNKKFLNTKIKEANSDLDFRRKMLDDYRVKVESYSQIKDPHPDILESLKDAESWVVYLTEKIEESKELLDIFYSARDLTRNCTCVI